MSKESGYRKTGLYLFKNKLIRTTILLAGAIAILIFFYSIYIYSQLPNVGSLKEYSYSKPMRVVTNDGVLLGEIGIKKRIILEYDQIPPMMINAILAAEDDRFFSHSGIDIEGLIRAVFEFVKSGKPQSGASTITMQVAREFFLSRNKDITRKFQEILLAFKLENTLSKKEIISLYMNKIFLGHRSYGFATASLTYYNKELKDLSIDEYAMLAGLPKAPSIFNPITNPQRAELRRNYVLRRLMENDYISEEQYKKLIKIKVHAQKSFIKNKLDSGYIVEMVRTRIIGMLGKESLENGLTIVTNINSKMQEHAINAVYQGLHDYSKRHGYKGPIKHLKKLKLDDVDDIITKLHKTPKYGDLIPAIVTEVSNYSAKFVFYDNEQNKLKVITIPSTELLEYKIFDTVNSSLKIRKIINLIRPRDLIYLRVRIESPLVKKYSLSEIPHVETGFISIENHTGKIKALVGGFDYFLNKFNHVTLARRQAGSNFKPFIYSAALQVGYTPATIINDAPIVFEDKTLEDTWKPTNDTGKFYGETRLRVALAYSRNLVSIRILNNIGFKPTINHIKKFGIPEKELLAHRDLSLALGTAQLVPLEMATAYSVFANGGYKLEPKLIDKIIDANGQIIYTSPKTKICYAEEIYNKTCNYSKINKLKVIESDNAYLMVSMLQDVVNYGTARKIRDSINYKYLGGKTGTTNDQKDAWFSGFSPLYSTTVWVGFDTPTSLGNYEYGGKAALPIWVDYMKNILKNSPNASFYKPSNIKSAYINSKTGKVISEDTKNEENAINAVSELFREENLGKLIEDSYQTETQQTIQELFN